MVILSFCFVLNAPVLKSAVFFSSRKKNVKEQKNDNQPVVDGVSLKGDDLAENFNRRCVETDRDIEKVGNRTEILEGLVAKICINMSGDERLKYNLENGNNISILYLAEEQRLWLQGRLTTAIKNMNGLAAKQCAMQSELIRLGILVEENEEVMLRIGAIEDCLRADNIELKKILEQQDIQVRNDFEAAIDAAIIKSQQEIATRLTALQEQIMHVETSHRAVIKAQVAVQKQLQEAESQRQVQIAAQQEIKAAMESRLQEAESQRAAQMVRQASVPQEVLDRLDRLEASNAIYQIFVGFVGVGMIVLGAVALKLGIFNKSQKEIL